MHVRVPADVTEQPKRLDIAERMDHEIFAANAVARTAGTETFARAVFDGPVFKNRKKIARNIVIQAAGNGM